MADALSSSDGEVEDLARRRRGRVIGLAAVCALVIAGFVALADGPGRASADADAGPAPASQTATEVAWQTASGPADAPAGEPDDEPVIVRPEIVPLPSAGLGGIALLVVMALWRRANLRLTTRLH